MVFDAVPRVADFVYLEALAPQLSVVAHYLVGTLIVYFLENIVPDVLWAYIAPVAPQEVHGSCGDINIADNSVLDIPFQVVVEVDAVFVQLQPYADVIVALFDTPVVAPFGVLVVFLDIVCHASVALFVAPFAGGAAFGLGVGEGHFPDSFAAAGQGRAGVGDVVFLRAAAGADIHLGAVAVGNSRLGGFRCTVARRHKAYCGNSQW